jgi:hypothetical protein
LPKASARRKEILEMIKRVATAAGELEGEKAKRLAQIEKLFATTA